MRHNIDLSLKSQLKVVDDGGFKSKLKSIKIEDMPKIKDNLDQMRLSIESKVMELIQSPKVKSNQNKKGNQPQNESKLPMPLNFEKRLKSLENKYLKLKSEV